MDFGEVAIGGTCRVVIPPIESAEFLLPAPTRAIRIPSFRSQQGLRALAVQQRPKVLVFGTRSDDPAFSTSDVQQECDVIAVDDLAAGLSLLNEGGVRGVCAVGPPVNQAEFLLEAGGVLHLLPDGIALLDLESKVLWCNAHLLTLAGRPESAEGLSFFDVFGDPEIIGPDFCPIHTALGSGETARTTLRVAEKRYVQVDITPVHVDGQDFPNYLIAVVRDVSDDIAQRQRLNAVYRAGLELGDLQPQEVLEMSVDERIELLKHKILHYTQDVLKFDTVEIPLAGAGH